MPLLQGPQKPKPRKFTGDPEDFRATLGEHLEELRGRIVRAAVALTIGTVIGWFLYPPVLNIFYGVINRAAAHSKIKVDWKFLDLTQPFMLHFKMALYIGLVLAIPFIVGELWGFVKPGLKPHEIRPFRVVVPISMGLFVIGVGLGFMILDPAFQWFLSFSAETPGFGIIQQPSELIFFSVKMLLAFGLAFQLPLVIFFLTKIGLVSPQFLMRYWKQSTVGVFVVAMIVTPGGDPFSMLAMAIPMSALFFASILAANLTSRGKREENDVLNNLD
ncbi:MAG: twin-arginine translocase subunit TatC [Fimbriimonadaceae bacterium]|nr:twin-arginine translocase subunit TatC [Fimbriimonadaceae bacterium]